MTHPSFSYSRAADEGASLPPPSNLRWWIMIGATALVIGLLAFLATRGGSDNGSVATAASSTTTTSEARSVSSAKASTTTDARSGGSDTGTGTSGDALSPSTSSNSESDAETTTTALLTTTTLPEERQRDKDLASLVSFVEGLRGQPFRTDPDIVFLDNRQFQDRYNAIVAVSAEQTKEQLETIETVLASLRFFSPGLNIADQIVAQESDDVLGIYDPESGDLIIRGNTLTPAVKSVVVHELQHAWRDQHSDLSQSERFSIEDESVLAWSSLVEGDAVLSEVVWANGLTDEQFDELLQSQLSIEGADPSSGIPEIMVGFAQFPYAEGYDFTEWIAVNEGLESLDGVFENPPLSTEHILHPQTYLDGDDPVEVDPPKADGTVVSEGVLGEYIVQQMLALVVPSRVAEQAAAGWGGDWYVSYRKGKQVCTRINLVFDSGRDVEEFNDAIETWTQANPGTSFKLDDGIFELSSCTQT
ncbi:MAG: hypothetical protein KAZ88_05700 [Acidimicrobiia bacterium]|nr:hypothetical protein [Acidimicrobiia bacterium]